MSSSKINIEEFRTEYLSMLEEILLKIESDIIKLEKLTGDEFTGMFYEVFRQIHSLKGSAGSYEFYMLTTIFHRFEDYLNSNIKKEKHPLFFDNCFKYLDIVKNCVQDYKEKNPEIEKYSSVIEDLIYQNTNTNGKILLIEQTQSIKKIITKIANINNFEITILNNGATALNRLIHERFDIVISSRNIDLLDGDSLLRGIKTMRNLNQKTPMILISSDDSSSINDKKSDFKFISKDNNLMVNIDKFVKENILKKNHREKVQTFNFEKVLVAEDDILIQKIVKKIFSKVEDIELTITHDFKTSIDALVKQDLDLIILDYFFKDCVGTEILQQYFRRNGRIETPIIFMTATPENVKLSELQSFGNVVGVIEKPINIRTFLEEINQVVSNVEPDHHYNWSKVLEEVKI